MKIDFERFVSRNVANFIRSELKLAGVKTDPNKLLGLLIIGSIVLFAGVPLLFLFLKFPVVTAALGGIISAAVLDVLAYTLLEFKIERRKDALESLLPDFLQITSANLRSGIALDKALTMAARPEFGEFSEEIKNMDKLLYAGVNLQTALLELAKSYRSTQLQHTVRMIIEGIVYGGAMTDMLNQIAKDVRTRLILQKEISGQLFIYTIFVTFAAVIGAPVLYALTSQMVRVTFNVWAGIKNQTSTAVPNIGISFLKLRPPQVTIAAYHSFAIAAIILVTGFGAFIVSTISSGSVFKGVKYLPLFIIAGLLIFFIVSTMIGGLFASISSSV